MDGASQGAGRRWSTGQRLSHQHCSVKVFVIDIVAACKAVQLPPPCVARCHMTWEAQQHHWQSMSWSPHCAILVMCHGA